MGCMKSKPKYQIIIESKEQPYYLNIYKDSENEYIFTGVLSPDITNFYLVFKKVDEERLPLAISFELSDDDVFTNQYQFLKLRIDKTISNIENTSIQFPDTELSNIYSCDVSPSYPFPIDIYGRIKLKT